MATGTLVNKTVDAFPKAKHKTPGPTGPRETDVDITLRQLVAEGQVPSRVLMFLDYNIDTDPETGVTEQVPPEQAGRRAGGRVQTLKKRGYAKEDGWVIKSIGGACYAQYVGAGDNGAGSLVSIGDAGNLE